MWTDFQNSFTSSIRNKILYVYSPKISSFPPHLQYVAILTCETWLSKNVYGILRWTWQYV